MVPTAETPALTPNKLFKLGQQPSLWLMSAERLRAAADLILQDQAKQEVLFLRAHKAAVQEAQEALGASSDGVAHAEIKCEPPNYRPAQLLYAYAMENVLKGLMIANERKLIGEHKLSDEIKCHNLVVLAEKAKFELCTQEKRVMEALSKISVWAGRYPVATTADSHGRTLDPDELLDWRAQHPVMRRCFDRAAGELEKKLTRPPSRFGVVVALGPKIA